ncbi:hypothetical protein HanRHA438_Chr12g0541021 [Helianthus annuus]|nr:hypothetical protein HanRHA438_Chr12g0541021 [Helianthus annuus]
MFSERCNLCKSCLIRSSQVILGLPLLLHPSTSRVSTTLTSYIICLIFTCLNHLNLPSFILCDILATSNLPLKTSFLIRSNLLCPHIHLSILISATSILRACTSLMAQQSVPNNIAGLIATL